MNEKLLGGKTFLDSHSCQKTFASSNNFFRFVLCTFRASLRYQEWSQACRGQCNGTAIVHELLYQWLPNAQREVNQDPKEAPVQMAVVEDGAATASLKLPVLGERHFNRQVCQNIQVCCAHQT